MTLNTGYLTTNRGVIKIFQVVCGIITCSLLCIGGGARNCFYDGRPGFASGLNFVCLIANVVFFFLVFLNIAVHRLERLYSLIGVLLFIVAFGLMVWMLVEYDSTRNTYIPATVLIGIQMALFIWDYQILHGQAWN